MLANLNARRSRGDRLKFPANRIGRVRLGVEAVMLGQPARKKDIDDRLGLRLVTVGRQRLERRQVIHAESQNADGPSLNRRATRETGMHAIRLIHATTS